MGLAQDILTALIIRYTVLEYNMTGRLEASSTWIKK